MSLAHGALVNHDDVLAKRIETKLLDPKHRLVDPNLLQMAWHHRIPS